MYFAFLSSIDLMLPTNHRDAKGMPFPATSKSSGNCLNNALSISQIFSGCKITISTRFYSVLGAGMVSSLSLIHI